jgi:hypothetical protein
MVQGFHYVGPTNSRTKSRSYRSILKIYDRSSAGSAKRGGTLLFYDENFRFDRAQIADIIAGRSVIYMMAHSEWKNRAGADFHYDSYELMQTPKTTFIGTMGWHNLSQ